ncbi:MAG: hypothetical protein H7A47_10740 [Verrucomicrobiales bacterium]|nr:hypothetical protein [Verrucomicrobiales bacterium]
MVQDSLYLLHRIELSFKEKLLFDLVAMRETYTDGHQSGWVLMSTAGIRAAQEPRHSVVDSAVKSLLSRIDSIRGSRRRVVGAEIQGLTRARRFRSAVTFR